METIAQKHENECDGLADIETTTVMTTTAS